MPGVCRRVQAERASLPERGGTFGKFAEFLPPQFREGWEEPEALRVEAWKEGAESSARVHASRKEWHRLLARMLAAGCVKFLPTSEVPRSAAGELITNGFFVVEKDSATDRTITNRRPRNAVERLLGTCGLWLPHGCCLVDLQVGADEVVVASMDDLSDFYHSIPTSPARTATNALGKPLSRGDVRAISQEAARIRGCNIEGSVDPSEHFGGGRDGRGRGGCRGGKNFSFLASARCRWGMAMLWTLRCWGT